MRVEPAPPLAADRIGIRLLAAGGIFALALALRMALLPVDAGFAFLTFYPAAVLTLFCCGLCSALVFVVAAALVGSIAFVPPFWQLGFTGAEIEAMAMFLASAGGIVAIAGRFQAQMRRQHALLQRELALRRQSELALQESEARLAADLLARARTEDELRASGERLRQFIEAAPAGIAMFDRDMRYLAVSRRFLENYHLAGDVVGRSHYDVFREIPQRWREIHRRCLAGETLASDEDPFLRVDGRVNWIRWKIQPWFEAAGAIGGIVLFSEDVTARKNAAAALQLAKADAERANAAKSRFMAAASHDLRQPLSAMSLYVGALESEPAQPHGEVVKHMKGCITHLNELLSDLLDVSRLQANVVKPMMRDFAVGEVLEKIAAAHQPQAAAKGLALRYRHSDAVGCTDPVLFQRVVGNLVSNAVRYSERGGLLIACRQRAGKTWVEVWDTGIGVPEDKIEVIFEEFTQLGNRECNPAKGTGLGLAIVAKTAQLLNLAVRVRSQVGKGSVFAIELPLGVAARAAQPRRHVGAPQRIALVEDNAEVAVALAYALRQDGHEVVAAASGDELLACLGTAPDVIVSDYRLSGRETGLDVIDRVRARFGAALPAVVVTGDTDPALSRSVARQAVRLAHKPLDVDGLRAVLGESRLERAA